MLSANLEQTDPRLGNGIYSRSASPAPRDAPDVVESRLIAFGASEHCFHRMGQCQKVTECPARALIYPFLKTNEGSRAQCVNKPGCISGATVRCAHQYLARGDSEARVCANVSKFFAAVLRMPRAISTCPVGINCPGIASAEVLEYRRADLESLAALG